MNFLARLRLILIIQFITGILFIFCSCKGKPAATTDARKPIQPSEAAKAIKSNEVAFTTVDGITIKATFKKPSGAGPYPACLLIHQLGRDGTTYSEFQDKLSQAGIASLAIDMRGHGRSTQNGSLDYKSFTTEQWASATADIDAGLQYLRADSSIDPNRICIVGSSIGANLAVIAAANHCLKINEPVISCLVLLSPGVNYHGVAPLARARDLEYIPVYILSGTEDEQSYKGAQSLSQAARGGELHSVSGDAHGTDIFASHPDKLTEIINWINNNIIPRTHESISQPPFQLGVPDSQPSATP